MAASRSDFSDEEWEALQRISRGMPEAGLVPSVMVDILVQAGVASRRGRRPSVSEAGKRLILKEKQWQGLLP
jgi:hypothetical protein